MSITPQTFKVADGISATRAGQGPLVVLIHGVGLQSGAWREMGPLLAAEFSAVALDMPGHGRSLAFEKTAEPRLSDYSDRISGAIASLGEPAILVGHSMGALIALDLASRNSETILGVVALNAIFRRNSDAAVAVRQRRISLEENPELVAEETLERWFGKSPPSALASSVEACRGWLSAIDTVAYMQAYSVFAQEDGPSDADLKKLTCPALFMTGQEDPNSTPDMSRAMASLAPSGTYVGIPEARHMLPMTHAAEAGGHILDFARRVSK